MKDFSVRTNKGAFRFSVCRGFTFWAALAPKSNPQQTLRYTDEKAVIQDTFFVSEMPVNPFSGLFVFSREGIGRLFP